MTIETHVVQKRICFYYILPSSLSFTVRLTGGFVLDPFSASFEAKLTSCLLVYKSLNHHVFVSHGD